MANVGNNIIYFFAGSTFSILSGPKKRRRWFSVKNLRRGSRQYELCTSHHLAADQVYSGWRTVHFIKTILYARHYGGSTTFLRISPLASLLLLLSPLASAPPLVSLLLLLSPCSFYCPLCSYYFLLLLFSLNVS